MEMITRKTQLLNFAKTQILLQFQKIQILIIYFPQFQANADALIVLLLPDGQVSVQDQFSPGYGVPSIDLRQNVQGKNNKN